MRQHKYRGQRLTDHAWVYGSLILSEDSQRAYIGRIHYLADGRPIVTFTEVDPATVGEWTGLQDKDGKDIYEGDIIRFLGRWDEDGKPIPPVDDTYEVASCMGGFWAIPKTGPDAKPYSSKSIGWKGVGRTDSIIIGSIHDALEDKP